MLSPDSISIPLKCICVNLHHVDKVIKACHISFHFTESGTSKLFILREGAVVT